MGKHAEHLDGFVRELRNRGRLSGIVATIREIQMLDEHGQNAESCDFITISRDGNTDFYELKHSKHMKKARSQIRNTADILYDALNMPIRHEELVVYHNGQYEFHSIY